MPLRFPALALLLATGLASGSASAQPRPDYPVIFVHGLDSHDLTWETTLRYLEGQGWGEPQTYHADLNASTSTRWADDLRFAFPVSTWQYQHATLETDSTTALQTVRVAVSESLANAEQRATTDSRLFAVNFEAFYDWDADIIYVHSDRNAQRHSESNCSAVTKQAAALRYVIADVLASTGTDRVILVGHSLGGLAIREYLQRRSESGTREWWIEPNASDGHRVVGAVTYGTPHQGSNFPDFGADKCSDSEGMRDVRYSYLTTGEIAPYLWGGPEDISAYFYNTDFNADGDEVDYVQGLNLGDPTSRVAEDSPSHPLPRDVRYSWITSDGDAIVDFYRQMLTFEQNGGLYLAPRGARVSQFVSSVGHLSQTSDYQTIAAAITQGLAVQAESSPTAIRRGLLVYPNPTIGLASATVTISTAGPAQLDVFDTLGRAVRTFEIVNVRPGEAAAAPLDLSGLPAGLYLVVLTDSAGQRQSVTVTLAH